MSLLPKEEFKHENMMWDCVTQAWVEVRHLWNSHSVAGIGLGSVSSVRAGRLFLFLFTDVSQAPRTVLGSQGCLINVN